MWLYLLGIVLVILGIAGLFAGGIYLIVLLPIGAIVLVAAVVSALWAPYIGGRERFATKTNRAAASDL